MPYKLDGNCVVKSETGETVPGGCHDTHEEAVKHLAALEANVKASDTALRAGEPLIEFNPNHDSSNGQFADGGGSSSGEGGGKPTGKTIGYASPRDEIKMVRKRLAAGNLKRGEREQLEKRENDLAKKIMDEENGPAESQTSQRTGMPIRESAPKVKALVFTEAAMFEAATGDKADVVLLRPGWSKNNRYYSKEAIGRAVSKFEGAQAYIDHPGREDEKNRPERSVRDLAGYYSNVRQSADGAMVGTLNLVGANGDYLKPLIAAATSDKPDLLGLSINAAGSTVQGEAEGRKGIIVEDITKSISTDIVTVPAAGGKFETLRASADEFTQALLDAMGYDEWREARPEHLDRLKREWRDAWRDEAVKTAEAQAKTLRETIAEKEKRIVELEEASAGKDRQLSDLSAENTRREMQVYADRLVAESRLPSAWRSGLRTQLLGESNSGVWPNLVGQRQTEYSAVRPPIPVKGAGIAGVTVMESIDRYPFPRENESPEAWRVRKQRLGL